MNIKIRTTARGVEVATLLLQLAIDNLNNSPKTQKIYKLSNTDLFKVERFKKSLVKTILNNKSVPTSFKLL